MPRATIRTVIILLEEIGSDLKCNPVLWPVRKTFSNNVNIHFSSNNEIHWRCAVWKSPIASRWLKFFCRSVDLWTWDLCNCVFPVKWLKLSHLFFNVGSSFNMNWACERNNVVFSNSSLRVNNPSLTEDWHHNACLLRKSTNLCLELSKLSHFPSFWLFSI